jgi:cardiolipin synthase
MPAYDLTNFTLVLNFLFGPLVAIFLYINALLIIITIIFLKPRQVTSIYLWIASFLLLPMVFVIVFYIYFGRDYRHQKVFRTKSVRDITVVEALRQQRKSLLFSSESYESTLHENMELARLLLNANRSFVTMDNEVRYFNEGDDFFKALFEEISGAKRFIHMEMYIIRKDDLGRRLVHELAIKAKAGVEVKLLCDAVGCQKLPSMFFDELKEAGGKHVEYFPSLFKGINTRINNRNHRKLVVIDGETGICSGFNVGIEYTGRGPMGPWRDDGVMMKGGAAIAIETRFIQDWNFAAKDDIVITPYLPEVDGKGKSPVQIVSGGPDSEHSPIRQHYVKMISMAKKKIYIQTPYFVPESTIIVALEMAAMSGVEVHLMIPSQPDHPFVFWASTYNAGYLLSSGVKVHEFKPGFIHAKICVIDDQVASVGSANFDVRSFGLNFETNAVIYDAEVAQEIGRKYLADVAEHCVDLTLAEYDARSRWTRVKEAVARLYTPIA